MREIKFRMYDKKSKQFTYWVFIQTKYGLEFRSPSMGRGIVISEARELSEQYTGLKDKNGVEIYEGDVVHCWGGASAFGYHEFEANILIDEFYQLRVSDIGYYDEFYVLGNIHDNPEISEAK